MFTGSTNNKYITPKVEWSSTQSGNQSTVKAEFYLKKSSSSTEATAGTGSWTININGDKKTISKFVTLNTNNTYQKIGEHTATVGHNSDGTKTITISVTGGISGTSYTTTTCSKAIALPKIAQKSLLNSVNTMIATTGSITFNWTVYNGNFTHKLNIRAGSTMITSVDIPKNKAGTYSKTIQLNQSGISAILTYMSSYKNITATYELQTLSGSTSLGSVSKTGDIKVTSASSPTFDGTFTYRDWSDYSPLTGDNQIIVQNRSELCVNIPSASAKDGASIKDYSITVGDKTVKHTSSGLDKYYDVITSSGATTVTVTATDSRGYTVSQKKTIDVIPYEFPKITNWEIRRVNEVEETITINIEGSVSPVVINGETKNKLEDDNGDEKILFAVISDIFGSDDFYLEPQVIGNSFKYTGTVDYEFNADKGYEIHILVKDKFMGGELKEVFLPKGKPLVSFRSGRVGINTSEPAYALDVDGDIGLSGTLPRVKLWSGTGSGALTKDQECELSDDLWNYRFVQFKAGTYVTYPLSTVYNGASHIRAFSSFAGEELIQIQAIRGTYTKPSNIPTFKLDMMTSFNISTSGITSNATNYTNITEIWGIK